MNKLNALAFAAGLSMAEGCGHDQELESMKHPNQRPLDEGISAKDCHDDLLGGGLDGDPAILEPQGSDYYVTSDLKLVDIFQEVQDDVNFTLVASISTGNGSSASENVVAEELTNIEDFGGDEIQVQNGLVEVTADFGEEVSLGDTQVDLAVVNSGCDTIYGDPVHYAIENDADGNPFVASRF